MIIISGVVSIVFQKNTLCTNKICVIYFCPNCVKFLLENVIFFIYLFIFFFGGGRLPPLPPSSCAYGCKRSFADVLQNRCYEKFRNVHMKFH